MQWRGDRPCYCTCRAAAADAADADNPVARRAAYTRGAERAALARWPLPPGGPRACVAARPALHLPPRLRAEEFRSVWRRLPVVLLFALGEHRRSLDQAGSVAH